MEYAQAMKIIDIEEAKADLERLVDEAARGAAFQISQDGKPVVVVRPMGCFDIELILSEE